MRIRYCSSPCGSGKTHQIINIACERANRGKKSLVLQPTRELIEKTVSQIRARAKPPEVFVFHRDKVGDGQVAKALAEHVKDCPVLGQIVFATHAILPHIKFLANREEWQIFAGSETPGSQYARYPQAHYRAPAPRTGQRNIRPGSGWQCGP